MITPQKVAQALLKIGAVGFKPDAPITFKSGIISPVYVDNRKFPFYPHEWSLIIEGFKELLEQNNIVYDVIAGIETAGIPHSAALGFALHQPSIFIRKKIKDHGTKSKIEGGAVAGKKVVLLEDLVTTGGSSLAGVEALREERAIVRDCIIIISYGFKESLRAFADAGVKLHSLTTFPIVLEEAYKLNMFTAEQKILIEEWFQDPWNWGKEHGFVTK